MISPPSGAECTSFRCLSQGCEAFIDGGTRARNMVVAPTGGVARHWRQGCRTRSRGRRRNPGDGRRAGVDVGAVMRCWSSPASSSPLPVDGVLRFSPPTPRFLPMAPRAMFRQSTPRDRSWTPGCEVEKTETFDPPGGSSTCRCSARSPTAPRPRRRCRRSWPAIGRGSRTSARVSATW